MPELPEIEVICRSIQHLIGKKILNINVRQAKLRWAVPLLDFEHWVVGRTLETIRRRGKYLLWHLDNRAILGLHFGMSGRLELLNAGIQIQPHTHIIFQFPDIQVRYRDPRRFGFVLVVPPGYSLSEHPRFRMLGVEPLSDGFSAQYLFGFTKHALRAIKNILMDASIVVGIGNIYANESLFLAGILPTRAGQDLKYTEIERIVDAVKRILSRAIERGGTTIRDHRDGWQNPGFFQQDLKVYQQSKCQQCNHILQKAKLTGRSTFWCPHCQI